MKIFGAMIVAMLVMAGIYPGSLWAQQPPSMPVQSSSGNASEDNIQPAIKITDEMMQKRGTEVPPVPSLFYSPDDLYRIKLAINTYLKVTSGNQDQITVDEADFLNKLAAVFGRKESRHRSFFTYPQFFLKSLVYHSENDWTLWINEIRLTHQTPENSELRVLAISKDKVDFEWTPTNMEKVLEVWLKQPTDGVSVDQNRRKVYFSLRPNQTFSSYKMTLLEGRALPVTVGIQEESGIQDSQSAVEIREVPKPDTSLPAAPIVSTPAQAPAGVSKPADNQGFSGLMNMYKNIGKDAQKP